MFRCGQCRHFERAKNNLKDLCGAWEQPTTATREACGFFMLRKPARDVKTAYFGAFRSVISGLSDHPFRFKPITDFAIIRSLLA